MRALTRRLARCVLPGLILALGATAAAAHEISDSRATLVLRDQTHVTMTLYVAYPELLFRLLEPGQPFPQFLVAYSAMDIGRFTQELLRAQARVEQGTRLYADDGRLLTLGRWAWPDPAAAQAMLRQRVMQETVDPSGAHEPPVEIRAEALASRAVRTVSVQFPAELQKVLVVAYRPTQTWVAPGERSGQLGF